LDGFIFVSSWFHPLRILSLVFFGLWAEVLGHTDSICSARHGALLHVHGTSTDILTTCDNLLDLTELDCWKCHSFNNTRARQSFLSRPRIHASVQSYANTMLFYDHSMTIQSQIQSQIL